MPKKVLQLKIVLDDTTPSVFRRIQVPESYTFAELRDAIQIAMEWPCDPNYWFICSKKKTNKEVRVGNRTEFDEDDTSMLDAKKTKIKPYIGAPGDVTIYELLVGDSWTHTVTVEKVLDAEPGKNKYPKCVGGRRTCPPWDIGGSGQFSEFVKAIKDPNHAEHDSYKDWLENMGIGDYNPDGFNHRRVKYYRKMWVLGPA